MPEEVDQERLYATTDASVWAEEFAKLNPEPDRGTMIAWFANAIETAKSHQAKADADLRHPFDEVLVDFMDALAAFMSQIRLDASDPVVARFVSTLPRLAAELERALASL